MTSHSLRFAVMGAGAVGGYFGARLGAELGVEAPIHRTAYAALKPYADGRRGEASSWATETALD
ncbi:MAG: hypothetical protein ACE5LL_06230 [Alphaproteobacteria bacterium]